MRPVRHTDIPETNPSDFAAVADKFDTCLREFGGGFVDVINQKAYDTC